MGGSGDESTGAASTDAGKSGVETAATGGNASDNELTAARATEAVASADESREETSAGDAASAEKNGGRGLKADAGATGLHWPHVEYVEDQGAAEDGRCWLGSPSSKVGTGTDPAKVGGRLTLQHSLASNK